MAAFLGKRSKENLCTGSLLRMKSGHRSMAFALLLSRGLRTLVIQKNV